MRTMEVSGDGHVGRCGAAVVRVFVDFGSDNMLRAPRERCQGGDSEEASSSAAKDGFFSG